MGLGKLVRNIWERLTSTVKKLWSLASPFLREVLSKSAQAVWESSKDLLVEAVQYVSEQGLPTDEAKREAFKTYLSAKLKSEISELKTSEINLLMEMAVSIAKKAAATS